uniref:hypothetical protein n=1 Tax=Streptococcus mitis TaxID=28037 RepID=UPI0021B7E72C
NRIDSTEKMIEEQVLKLLIDLDAKCDDINVYKKFVWQMAVLCKSKNIIQICDEYKRVTKLRSIVA